MTAFYGKLPAKGDFLSRNLPRDFIETWDGWLQAGMHESRDALGPEWLETYLTSPLWRFALPPGACGRAAYAGVFMPSMDRVGRYFPMAVLRRLPGQAVPAAIALGNTAWFESVEAQLLVALDEETLDVDAFDRSLRSIPFAESLPAAGFDGNVATRFQGGTELDLALRLLRLNDAALRDASAGFAFWWGNGSDLVEPSLLWSSGLPPPACFTAMLCGAWDRYGWQDKATRLTSTGQDPLARLVDDLVD